MKLLGIDEAGRGPVLGSLVIAGIVCMEDEIPELIKLGVRDSKTLSPARREELFAELTSCFSYSTVELTPQEIDSRHRRRESLNQMEARAMLSLIHRFSPEVAYIDCVGRSTQKFIHMLGNVSCKLVVEHRADRRYPIVSAASIIAKVVRDRSLEELKQEYGDFGSGYPGDPRTVAFLKENLSSLPPFVRTTWRTLSRIKNRSLESFK
ncbi:ribonuclease HII [Candidatus Pyrohabitans sp.]